MRRFASAALAFCTTLWFGAGTAQALPLMIDFDLSETTISMLSGTIDVPPDGALTSARLTLTIEAIDLETPLPGAVQLTDLEIAGVLDTTVAGSANLTGDLFIQQFGTAGGFISGDLALISIFALTLDVAGAVDCTPGNICQVIGDFPLDFVSLESLPNPTQLLAAGLDTPGGASLEALLTLDINGSDVVVDLSGQETRRYFAPEPNTTMLIGLGLLGLAGIRRQAPLTRG